MTADAREAVLARIREALRDAPPPLEVPRAYRMAAPPGTDVVGLFAERAADYRATVRRCPPEAVATTVAAALAERAVRRIAVPAGIEPAWLGAAAEQSVTTVGDDPPLSHAELDAIDAVVTGCAVAIAETGTIVLDGGPGQGRRALTLLPDHHVCVVTADQVVGDVPEALARLDARRPLTWISGPSATSDIELERVEGVHGPRVLDIVLVDRA